MGPSAMLSGGANAEGEKARVAARRTDLAVVSVNLRPGVGQKGQEGKRAEGLNRREREEGRRNKTALGVARAMMDQTEQARARGKGAPTLSVNLCRKMERESGR